MATLSLPGRRSPHGHRLQLGVTVAVLGLVLGWGLLAWIYQLSHGLAVTGMRDVVSWGTYIFTFAFFVGLSAGGLIVASAAEVFGVSSLKPLSRLGVLTAAACIATAAATIVPDLGHADRLLNLFIHAHWTSPMVWDVVLVLAYLLFALVDLTVLTRRTSAGTPGRVRTIRALAYVGLPMAVLLHSVTAWIFGLQSARQWWNTALMAPLFVVSAVLSGTALVAVAAAVVQRVSGRSYPAATWRAVTRLLVTALVVDLFLVACDYITIGWGSSPTEHAALSLILPGGAWQTLFWLEWVIGGLLPLLLLAVPVVRRSSWGVAGAGLLMLAGVYAFRIELVVTGMVHPLLALPPGNALGTYDASSPSFQLVGNYSPTWVEYSIAVALVALLVTLVVLGAWALRVQDDAEAT